MLLQLLTFLNSPLGQTAVQAGTVVVERVFTLIEGVVELEKNKASEAPKA